MMMMMMIDDDDDELLYKIDDDDDDDDELLYKICVYLNYMHTSNPNINPKSSPAYPTNPSPKT